MYSEFIPRIINKRICEEGFTAKSLANILYVAMGYSTPNGANNFISHSRKHENFVRRKEDPERDRRNFSILLYALGIPQDHNVILKIQGNMKFQYPPENGIPYEEIKAIKKNNSGGVVNAKNSIDQIIRE